MSIYEEVRAERERAQKIHGDMSMDGLRSPLSLWRMPILTEEVGEVARALLEVCFHGGELADLRYELIQVAAAATAWADAISAQAAMGAASLSSEVNGGAEHGGAEIPLSETSVEGMSAPSTDRSARDRLKTMLKQQDKFRLLGRRGFDGMWVAHSAELAPGHGARLRARAIRARL